MLREVARQGLLPYPTFFVSTKPFGTPLGPVVLMYLLTVLIIVAVPGKDAFNFIVDLESYPNLVRPFLLVDYCSYFDVTWIRFPSAQLLSESGFCVDEGQSLVYLRPSIKRKISQ